MKRSILLASCALAGATFLSTANPGWGAEDTLKAATVYMTAPGDFSASKLTGVDIVNAAGEKIGDISDVAIAPNGRPRIVMSVGDFLGMGEHRVAVDWGVIALSGDETGKIHARLDMTKDQLAATPEYRGETAAP